ncbi:hypothetical protein IZ6_25620 [Terrihabitans soli]|uniref:Uncharacterized protein n=1 Tax=Terrihabitans soli TaxID=708113 RepID=A0A6S6QV75_9HYPH|nr:hypothetical protein [Terrihabitans soli]BCJ91827.1 hypothetical protein IZ6_25620 [Terrihabitans soli]
MKHTPLPWQVDGVFQTLFCRSARGGVRKVLDIRGWGYLTGKGHGALGLSDKDAYEEQKAVALYVEAAVNCHEKLVASVRTLSTLLKTRSRADDAAVNSALHEASRALDCVSLKDRERIQLLLDKLIPYVSEDDLVVDSDSFLQRVADRIEEDLR